MELTATFDLGTTAMKCAVLDEHHNIVFSSSVGLTTYNEDGFSEQDPKQWWEAFCKLSSMFDKSEVDSIILSGQMQDLMFFDENDENLGRACLYNDQRGAGFVADVPSYVKERTSVAINGTIPITKLLWFRKNRPDVISRARHILIGAKDYIIMKLTGRYVSDVTNMATSGMMDIHTLRYIDLDGLVDPGIRLPEILHSEEVAGTVSREAAKVSGYRTDTEVFVGSGDAGATTLASGISKPGEFNVNLGTTGWIATISDRTYPDAFNLAAINHDLYINVIGILNGASVHNWVSRMLFGDGDGRYGKLHELLVNDGHSNPDLLCMPYLVGERFPVADPDIRGSYYGLDSKTTKADLARSALEGVAFSLRQGLEVLDITAKSMSLVGGGAAESVWCQIFSDVFGIPVMVFANSDILPSMALSAVVQFGRGRIRSYAQFIDEILKKQDCTIYKPDGSRHIAYTRLYERFKLMYEASAGLRKQTSLVG